MADDRWSGNPSDHEQNIRQIGECWVAEEALAVAIYYALAAGDDLIFRKAPAWRLTMTATAAAPEPSPAISCRLISASQAIAADWVAQVELSQEITQLADDLLVGYQKGDEWRDEYPGW